LFWCNLVSSFFLSTATLFISSTVRRFFFFLPSVSRSEQHRTDGSTSLNHQSR
jgi:hypothetical protein